jgi:hypothetical protein
MVHLIDEVLTTALDDVLMLDDDPGLGTLEALSNICLLGGTRKIKTKAFEGVIESLVIEGEEVV